jgi:hypothetical protein
MAGPAATEPDTHVGSAPGALGDRLPAPRPTTDVPTRTEA